MSDTKNCPHCGGPLDSFGDPSPGELPARALATEGQPIEQPPSESTVAGSPLLAPGSNDEAFLQSAYDQGVLAAELDPILGNFIEPLTAVPLTTANPSKITPTLPSPTLTSELPFTAINLDRSSRPSTNEPSKTSNLNPTSSEETDEDDEIEESRNSWGRILLASYASAVTLALIWFVMKDRSREIPPRETPQAGANLPKVQSPTTGYLSKPVHPPEPILGEHFVKMRKPITIGSLEITPIEVTRSDVKLQRSSVLSVPEVRTGGKKALVLRLKLKNISTDSIFAPLDPIYLRERGENLVDTFVTTANQERIYPYSLAIESEWSIVGQDLKELRPGESRTIAIVTAPEAPTEEAGPFTWRVRLRTGIDRTDVIGLVWPEPATSQAN